VARHQRVAYPLVHALVVPAQNSKPGQPRQRPRHILRERLAVGRHQENRPRGLPIIRCRDRLDRREQGLGLHHHARAAAERIITVVRCRLVV
jgi:hypothetical protein